MCSSQQIPSIITAVQITPCIVHMWDDFCKRFSVFVILIPIDTRKLSTENTAKKHSQKSRIWERTRVHLKNATNENLNFISNSKIHIFLISKVHFMLRNQRYLNCVARIRLQAFSNSRNFSVKQSGYSWILSVAFLFTCTELLCN